MSNKDRSNKSEKPIIIHLNSSEEEITQKLKAAPLDLTVKITAAIGNVWQQSA